MCRLPPNCFDSEPRHTNASARNKRTGILRLQPVHAIVAHEDDLHIHVDDFNHYPPQHSSISSLRTTATAKLQLLRYYLGDAIVQWLACSTTGREVVGSSPIAGRRQSRSNRGPVAICTVGLGLLNPPSSRGR